MTTTAEATDRCQARRRRFRALRDGSASSSRWPARQNGCGGLAGMRGPRDGISPETIPPSWPARGLKRLWRADTGGFSSFVVAGNRAFTVVNQGAATRRRKPAWRSTRPRQTTLEPPTGAPSIRAAATAARGNRGGDGPRSTPATDGQRVWVYSSALVLHCLDAAGKGLWQRTSRPPTPDEH